MQSKLIIMFHQQTRCLFIYHYKFYFIVLFFIMGNCSGASEVASSPIKVNVPAQQPTKHTFKQIKELYIPQSLTSNGKITDVIIKNQFVQVGISKAKQEKFKQNKQLFVDQQFPTNDQSVGTNEHGTNIVWQRPAKFIEGEYKIFEGIIDPTDIHQGKLGDCYLMSALAIISQHPYIILRLFENLEVNQSGLYGIWLCIDGIWQEIVVDDLFPTFQNIPIFSKNHGKEIWVLLIEKAYAKAHGSYHKIQSGLTGVALNSLTGAPYEYFNKQYNVKSKEKEAQLWEFIKKNYDKGYFLAGSSEKNDKNEHFNIVSGHSYAILDIRQVKIITKNGEKSEKILKLMNPWGRFQWKGKWSDESPVWTSQLKQQLKWQGKNDGIFWMNLHDFSQTFGQVCATKYHKDYLYTSQKLQFKKESIGFKGIFLTVNIRTKGYITLTQHDHRKYDNYRYAVLRMIIMEINAKSCHFQKYINDFIDCGRDCTLQMVFEPGLYYLAIQADWPTEITRDLILSYYGDQPVIFTEDKELPESMDSLLNQMIVLHQAVTQKQRIHQYANDNKIRRITGSLAGYVYYHYTNESQHDKYLVETVTLKQRKFISVHNEEKNDQFSVRINPNDQKIIKLRVDSFGNGSYSYSTKIQFYIVQGYSLERLRELCDKKPTKVKKREIEGKPIEVYVKTFSYSGGIAVLYLNKMDKYAFVEQVELQLQNLELENDKMNSRNQVEIELEPHSEKLLSFLIKKPGQSVSFKTTMSFYLNSPEFKF